MGIATMITGLSAAILPGLVRSVGGWAENAFKDGYIDKLEWEMLGSTILRVGIMGVMIHFGLGQYFGDVDLFASGATAYILDTIFYALKKR